MLGEEVGDLLQDGSLANPALPVDDEDVVNEFSCQAVLDPAKDILATEEHARFNNGGTGDIWIAQVTHDNNPTL